MKLRIEAVIRRSALAVIGLITAALLLTGCQSLTQAVEDRFPSADSDRQTDVKQPETDDSTSGEALTLTFWHSMADATGQLLESIIEDYNHGPGKDAGITVTPIYQGKYTDATTKLRTVLQADQVDELPDIMQIDAQGIMNYQDSEYRYTVDEAMEQDKGYDLSQILEVPLKNWYYDDTQLGMPFSTSSTLMYYNRTLLEQIGVSEPPTTFREIIELAEKLPDTNAEGQPLTALAAVPNSPSVTNWIGQLPSDDRETSYVVNQRNGRDGRATELVADQEGTLAIFLEGWKDMYDQGALLNQSEGITDLFLAQRIALMFGSSTSISRLPEQIQDAFELGAAPFPRIHDDAHFGATVSGSGLFMFDRGDTSRAQASWEVVKYLCSPEVQANFSIGSGYFPSHRDAYKEARYIEAVEEQPLLAIAPDQVEATSPDMAGITVGPSWDFYTEIQNQISGMLEQGTSVEDTVPILRDTLNDLLDQYNLANPVSE